MRKPSPQTVRREQPSVGAASLAVSPLSPSCTASRRPRLLAPPRQRVPGAYGAWAADKLLPNVIGFTPGTALWDPWADVQNGKGIVEDIASNIIKMVVNQDFSSGLEPGPVLDHFPYLAPPPVC